MTDTIRITCQNCHGSGVTDKRHPTGDPQLETIGFCDNQRCYDGYVTVDGHQIDEVVGAAIFVLWTSLGVTGVTPGATNRLLKAINGMGVQS